MTTIYRKTALGQAEIDARTRTLSPRVRSALVMVDGRRSDDELRQLVAQVDDALSHLLEAGLIEPVLGTRVTTVDIPLPALTPTFVPALMAVDISLSTVPGPLDSTAP